MPMILRNTDILFNSNAVLASPPGTAPMFAARAWVNFDGTSAVDPSMRASGNVSSVNRISTGRYRVNFTTALPDANSCAVVSSSEFFAEGTPQGNLEGHAKPTFITTTYVEIRNQFHVRDIATRAYDAQLICVSVFR